MRLLNSVPFGIVLMVLVAVYIAMGSARPWLREMGIDEWPLLRNWFDKTDLQFFNAWPLKTLMTLLVTNLIVVTWRKIPLTPPRYGVWCIHAGIITLVCGTACYYYYKVEGRVRIYTNGAIGPAMVDHFYDKDERSLYVRIGQDNPAEIPLPTLPRFKEYDEQFGNTGALASRGLVNIQPTLAVTDRTGETRQENLAEMIGCHGKKLSFDVVGFYPYATTSTDFTTDPASVVSGVDVTMQNVQDSQAMSEWWLVGSDPRFRTDFEHTMDMQHLDADASMVAVLTEAAGQLFKLDITAPGQEKPQMLLVQVGKSYPVAGTGYTLQIESFQPSWSMFGTGEQTPMLQMIVTAPTQNFRRMVLQDKPVQTDFKLGDSSAGPMGKRQKVPLDEGLKIDFHVHDPYNLLPTQNEIKHTFLTPPGTTELVDIVAGFGSVDSEIRRSPNGSADIEVTPENQGMNAPFAGAAATPPEGADSPPNHPAVKIHVDRRDHLKPVDSIIVVPPARRDKNAEDEGDYQIAKLKVSMGDWSTIVFAPFADDAGDRLRQDHWRGGYVTPPGAIAPLQFQLGNMRRELPVRLSLDRFDLVPYPGAKADDPNAMFLDYISTVTLSDINTGDTYTDKAQMNHPIYFHHGDWLFFQAAYDSSGGHEWTRLGVGNRPFIGTMMTGCCMIFVGLAYAFYVKPIIIQRMKRKAIADAVAAGKMAPREMVSV